MLLSTLASHPRKGTLTLSVEPCIQENFTMQCGLGRGEVNRTQEQEFSCYQAANFEHRALTRPEHIAENLAGSFHCNVDGSPWRDSLKPWGRAPRSGPQAFGDSTSDAF